MNKKEIEEHRRLLIELVKEKELKIRDLQQIIDKAIEYVKECEEHLVIQPQKLLEILEGKNE